MARTATLLSISALLALAGCGTPGPPLPPSLDLPRPVSDLSVTREGDRITVAFTAPEENTDKLALKQLGSLILEQCGDGKGESCSRLQDWPGKSIKPGERVTWSGALPSRPYLLIVANNDRERSAAPGNAQWVPLATAAAPVRILNAKTTPNGVVLTLQPSDQQGATLRIMRKSDQDRAGVELSEQSATTTTIEDDNIEWQRTYTYSLETLNRATAPDGTVVEFASAEPVTATVITDDVFPPVAPTGLAAVFTGTEPGKTSIELSWNPNTERDIAGYNVYRDNVKLTREPVKAPYYRDLAVAAGASYSYAVTAVDLRGNESPRSTAATESVPQQP